jgi:hypothetical protein
MMSENPEIGLRVDVGGVGTNYIRSGEGPPLILIHGSGPGVTAYANWRGVIPDFAQHFTIDRNHIHTHIIPGPANDYLRRYHQPPNLKLACLDRDVSLIPPNHPHHINTHPINIPSTPTNFEHFTRLYSTEPCFTCLCGAFFTPVSIQSHTVCSHH